jgi:hypothetical protein
VIRLVGVAHQFQLRPLTSWKEGGPIVDPAWVDRFERYLRRAVAQLHPQAICEEYSQRQISETTGGAVSVAQSVANSRNLTHIFCDPNAKERAALYSEHGTTEEDDKRAGYPLREGVWIQRLSSLLPETQILFICGACHVPTFFQRLRDKNIPVKVLHRDLAASWKFSKS